MVEDFNIAMWLIAAANFMSTRLLRPIISTTTQLLNVLGNDVNSGLPNRDSTEGLFQIPLTTHKGQRKWTQGISTQHSNSVNSDGSKKYPLTIKLQMLATKITFLKDATSGKSRATGIEYLEGKSLYCADPRYAGSQGTPGSVTTSREVIISAGAFNTLSFSDLAASAHLPNSNPLISQLLPTFQVLELISKIATNQASHLKPTPTSLPHQNAHSIVLH